MGQNPSHGLKALSKFEPRIRFFLCVGFSLSTVSLSVSPLCRFQSHPCVGFSLTPVSVSVSPLFRFQSHPCFGFSLTPVSVSVSPLCRFQSHPCVGFSRTPVSVSVSPTVLSSSSIQTQMGTASLGQQRDLALVGFDEHDECFGSEHGRRIVKHDSKGSSS